MESAALIEDPRHSTTTSELRSEVRKLLGEIEAACKRPLFEEICLGSDSKEGGEPSSDPPSRAATGKGPRCGGFSTSLSSGVGVKVDRPRHWVEVRRNRLCP